MDVQLPGCALCSCRRALLKLSAALFVQLETCASGLCSASIVTELLLGNFKRKIDFFFIDSSAGQTDCLACFLVCKYKTSQCTVLTADSFAFKRNKHLFSCVEYPPSALLCVCECFVVRTKRFEWTLCAESLLALDKSLIAASFISLTCNFPSEYFFFLGWCKQIAVSSLANCSLILSKF